MTSQVYGNHSNAQAWRQTSTKLKQNSFANNLTRRNLQLVQRIPNRSLSTCLASANLKSLRLFRYICRMIPFVLKTHEIEHRFSGLHSKRYIANYFRQNSKLTNLIEIDGKIQQGYQFIHEAEWHIVNTGYLYQYLAGPAKIIRDHGINRYQDLRGSQNKKQAPTGFLRNFYHGRKSHTD